MGTGEGERRGRGRPRAPGAEQKILQAALEEYTEHGWSGFTMDGVARRSGFGKSTLYLRWTDKDALLTEAVRRRSRQVADVDTGTLRGDLTALVTGIFRESADPQGWAGFRMIVETASSSSALGNFTQEAASAPRGVLAAVFERARERGEIRGAVDPIPVSELIHGAAILFVLGRRLDHLPITGDELGTRVDWVVTTLLEGLG
ncbi:TetR/AcrR family transcriptional regulator [Nocardioides sp. YIM 152315]|uniref:TetR/AcrR family transcriptional regulator n=1 Tax=Nocardioides sp. YIM 152315 TaxID=3031760 RepID=UPI0023DC7011|nr:TetR/AcrR family transcriptional regulator [Nocardioides sp. YIM 152315]MDF1604973.1 TetR/AcrR family transcriptional regulator [Nocardioides sp. YIM 152315]